MLAQKIKELILSKNKYDPELFNTLALRLFRHQFNNNKVYQKICKAQNCTEPANWTQIPLITTELYKTQTLFCLSETEIAKTFLSSGTTQTSKSKHYLSAVELDLYEESLWQTFSEALIPFDHEIEYFVLTESPTKMPNSSLIHMFEVIRRKVGAGINCYFMQNGELELLRLENELKQACKPVLMVGTAFSFVHLLDSAFPKLNLPQGSRIMETGGFKGKSREISKQELYQELCKRFNLPVCNIVGQYGMSECGTQYYDFSFLSSSVEASTRWKKAPAWSRIRILNPANLEREAAEGEIGLIAIYDLANYDSAAFVLTGDLAIKRPNHYFEVIGRAQTLTPKGCSLTTDMQIIK